MVKFSLKHSISSKKLLSRGFLPSKTPENSKRDYNQYFLSPWEWLKWFSVALAFAALAAWTFYRSILVLLLFLPAAVLYPFFKRKDLCRKRKHQLLMQFREAIQLLSSFLSAGYSTENAFRASLTELQHIFGETAMISREFEAIAEGMGINTPVTVLLQDFADRSGLEDVSHFTEIFSVARKKGGSLSSIIAQTTTIIREKLAIEEDIRTQNASRMYEQRIMNLLPFLIILYMNFSSPDFFTVLYTTLLGRTVMTVCLLLYGFSVWLASRILQIEV